MNKTQRGISYNITNIQFTQEWNIQFRNIRISCFNSHLCTFFFSIEHKMQNQSYVYDKNTTHGQFISSYSKKHVLYAYITVLTAE